MSRPDEATALEAAVRWGRDYRDVHRDRAGDLWSVLAHGMRHPDGRPVRSAAPGLFVHVTSCPAGLLDAIVIVYALEERLEVCISAWRLPCSVCGRMAGTVRAEGAS